MSAVCTCKKPTVVPAQDNIGAYCSTCGYWYDTRYGSVEPNEEPQYKHLPGRSAQEIREELQRRRGMSKERHGKQMAQQKNKAKNRAKRRNK
jgi:hypothetical protein